MEHQSKQEKPRAAILGGGSFGTALAIHLEQRVHVRIWEFVAEQAKTMHETRYCPLLPKARIPHSIAVSNNLEETVSGAAFVILAVPSFAVVKAFESALPSIGKGPFITQGKQEHDKGIPTIILCSKGLHKETSGFLSEQIQQRWKGPFAVVCGPTHAEEVSEQKQTIAVVASSDSEVRARVSKLFASPHFHIEETDDVLGVQLCSAVKNIYAIWMGILDGLNEGDNTKALLSTLALREMKVIVKALGGRTDTVEGPAGVGDFIVTCLSKHSRNRNLGEQLGRGKSLKEALAGMKMVAEGVDAGQIMHGIITKKQIKAPFISGLWTILQDGAKPHAVFDECVRESLRNHL